MKFSLWRPRAILKKGGHRGIFKNQFKGKGKGERGGKKEKESGIRTRHGNVLIAESGERMGRGSGKPPL